MDLHLVSGHLPKVPGISPYSKLLLTAGCAMERPSDIYTNTTSFCPGYTDARRTPLYGVKEKKLVAMADMFCSSCTYGDHICDTLFCEPSRLIVRIVMSTMNAICQTMEHTHIQCYQEFCDGFIQIHSRSRRQTTCTEFEPTEQFTGVSGMPEWCQSMCTKGHCPTTHCQCVDETGTIDRDTAPGTSSTSSVTMTTEPTTKFTTFFPSTSESSNKNIADNATDDEHIGIISDIICEHGKVYQQNQLTERYCNTDNETVTSEKEYDQDIIDQLQSVGPQLMCALSSQTGQSEMCSSMFCDQNPTASLAVQMSMCNVCGEFSDLLSENCVKTYCL